MPDDRSQPWQVSYEGKSAQQLTVTAPTALDAAKDFALQRPNSGTDCVVRVSATAAGGTAQSFVRERGVWRPKEDTFAPTAPVRSNSAIGFVQTAGSAQTGLTVTSIRLSFRDLFVLIGKLWVVTAVYGALAAILFLIGLVLVSLLAGAAALSVFSPR